MQDLSLNELAMLMGMVVGGFLLIIAGMAVIVLFDRIRERQQRRSRSRPAPRRREAPIPEIGPAPMVLSRTPAVSLPMPEPEPSMPTDLLEHGGAAPTPPWWYRWWMQVRSSRLQEDSQDTSETESTPRGDAADLDAAAPSTVETPVPSASAEPEVIGFRQWWRELWEIVNHLFVLGGTGSGKTTTVRAMVRYIALVLKHQVVILDPKANVDTWCGLRAQTKAEAIESMLQVLLADFENRLERNATLTEAEAQQAFRHVWIVVDELSFVRDNCPTWQLLIRRLSSMARALNMHLIIINQSATAEEIGLKGRADLLKNFSRLQLSKAVWRGKPASLNLDGEAMTIEWKPVTVLSQKTPVLPPSAGYVAPDLGRQETAPAAAPEAPPAAAGSPAGSGGRSETVANQALRSALAEPTAITPVPKPVEASTASIESTDEKDDLVIALAREGLTQREIQRRLNEKFDSGMNNNRLAELHKKGRALAAAQPPDATGEASTASDVPQAAVGDVSLKKLAAA